MRHLALVLPLLLAACGSGPDKQEDTYSHNALGKPIVERVSSTPNPNDLDGDGYFASDPAHAAWQDCDDHNAAINPGMAERCSGGVDEDCDTFVDGADADEPIWNGPDRDNDGFGVFIHVTMPDTGMPDTNAPVVRDAVVFGCDAALVWSAYNDQEGVQYDPSQAPVQILYGPDLKPIDLDCDDMRNDVHPFASEICDGRDNDCDGDVDENAVGAVTVYYDGDHDGHGSPTVTSSSCVPPGMTDYVSTGDDCDDGNAAVHPGAIERCNGIDDDCDTLVDDADDGLLAAGGLDVSTATTWFADADGDSYGSDSTVLRCVMPEGYAARGGDCNDSSSAISPAATEVCDASNTDEDCDGLADNADPSATGKSTFYRDGDSDGYGLASAPVSTCDAPEGYVVSSLDCNDARNDVNPGAPEVCDAGNTDEDCDGRADDRDSGGATGKVSWYRDYDADGFGRTGTAYAVACDAPVGGYVVSSTDCRDDNAAINPTALEIADNNVDENCDGLYGGCNPDTNTTSLEFTYTSNGTPTTIDVYGSVGNSPTTPPSMTAWTTGNPAGVTVSDLDIGVRRVVVSGCFPRGQYFNFALVENDSSGSVPFCSLSTHAIDGGVTGAILNGAGLEGQYEEAAATMTEPARCWVSYSDVGYWTPAP